ncbi:MAG TPA: type ISP restriction/modification enzyme [Solirubrobacteraceae bacterium]|nr:type ISP restriction/modification enzyme [Solirubrobacteraceae bacterium]
MLSVEAVEQYASELQRLLATGHAAEHAYRPALQRLMEQTDEIDAVNDPRQSEYGSPDFVFLRRGSKTLILGWAEAKDLTADLTKIEKTEQLQRYSGYSNLYLTNYVEFRFYSSGSRYADVVIGENKDSTIKLLPENYEMLASLLSSFLAQKPQPIRSGVRLAQVMGGMGRRIRTAVGYYLSVDSESNAELLGIYGMIKELLVHDLDKGSFADMYAQTLVYGLFAARYNDTSPDNFTRAKARELVPASNPFLQQFFDHIAGANFDWRLARIVDELCEIFAVSGVREIVHQHLMQPSLTGEQTDDMDPIIHFYEDFLQAYDPDQRKRMGAYYTPVPVVRFMVRMVDHLLKAEFGLTAGIADTSKTRRTVVRADKKVAYEFHKVQILDPAVGTATFLNEIIEFIRRGFHGQEGRWPAYVREDLVPRLSGFELMMAPYTVAHLKLGLTLRESGVSDFGGRLGVYLTNALEEGMNQPQTLFHFGLAEAVAQEALHAGEIKTERPVMVVIGNPPYAAISSNETEWANALVDRYKVEPGGQAKLKERKHWLNDDYVKFLSFAEQMIERNGSGVVAMITNHGYLDNPTFRGMRWRLAQTFDSIYVLDLHGNTMKKETNPSGGKDENIFQIQQGVAIMFGVRTGKETANRRTKRQPARVMHADLWGTRLEKFMQLNADDADWKELELVEPMHYFLPRDLSGEDEYLDGISVADLCPVKVTGVVTMGDPFIVARSRTALEARLIRFASGDYDAAGLRREFALGKNYPEWIVSQQPGFEFDGSRVIRYAYRPFDERWTYLDKHVIWRTRDKMSRHFLGHANLGLIVSRQAITDSWSHVQVTPHVADNRIHYSNKGIPLEIPLYLHHDDGSCEANLDTVTLLRLTKNVSAVVAPEDVLDYVYGILHSPAYRATYETFLKNDFPRVPVPRDDDEWSMFVGFGRRLRDLHLMDTSAATDVVTTYPVVGSDVVETVRFDAERVWINGDQYFGAVPEVTWNLPVGGYLPAQRWLKERKGSKLDSKDIEHYQRIITVLAKTDEIMHEIDA